MTSRNFNLELRPHSPALLPDPADPLCSPRDETFWTGPVPLPGRCAGVDAHGTLHSLRQPHLLRCARADVRDYFDNTWALTEGLFSSLMDTRAYYSPPYHRLRHPLIFYFGHSAVLYVNKLRIAGLVPAIRPDFEMLFSTGVDEMSWDDLTQAEQDWPPLLAVRDYRREVYRRVRALIEEHPALGPDHPAITQAHPLWALFMSMEHERIHLETSSVLIRELPVEWVRRPPQWPALHRSASSGDPMCSPLPERDFPDNRFVEVPGGAVRIGKPSEWPSFGWDNEYGERTAALSPFRVQRFLVSNGEFLEFVKAEGYLDPALWSRDGWGWRQFRNARWPTFWVSASAAGLHDYRLRTQFEIIDMPWAWPVEVNYHEAQAFRAFRQRRDGRPRRLLSEAMHQALRGQAGGEADGFAAAAPGQNLNLVAGSPGPVDGFAANPLGVHDVFGNVWQWCEDHFHPLPGFAVHPVYDDFSTPCFDGQHQMILGGSFISTGDEASVWARFHFRPHFFQHAGFRLVEPGGNVNDVVRLRGARGETPYESERALREYLGLHYGSAADSMPFAGGPAEAIDFPRRCAARLIDLTRAMGIPPRRALDVGCAVGRTSFELARVFAAVVGVDRSERFIAAAKELQTTGRLSYFLSDEGDLGREVMAVVPPDIERDRVRFLLADACALPADLGGFEVVMAMNLLCRLSSPRSFLARLGGPHGLVAPGGLLLLTTPATWSEEYTPRAEWLGGFQEGGRAVATSDGVYAALGEEFELLVQEDMPLLIREHRRKYQYIVTQLSAWRRRAARAG